MNTNIVYTKEYCRQLEIAYGNNMMSEGGSIELDYMFNNEEITNKKLLDFGSGLGGAAFYLAQKYSAHVTGVEISSTMVNLSNESTPADLKERVIFKLYNNQNSRLPFANDSFDIIYSKGVLVHLSIEEKEAIFIEFKRILKNTGKIIIHDWISPYNLQWGENINYLIESERLPLYAHDKDHYINLLKESGFEVNCIDDRSHNFAQYNHDIAVNLNKLASANNLPEGFNKELAAEHSAGYRCISEASRSGELLNLLFKIELYDHTKHLPKHEAPNYMSGKVKQLYEGAAKTYEISKTGSFVQLMACLELVGIENGCVGINVYVRMMHLLDNIDFSIDKKQWSFFNELAEMFRMPIHTYDEDLIHNYLLRLFDFPWMIHQKMNTYLAAFQKLQNSTYCIMCEDNNGLTTKPHRIFGIFHDGRIAQKCLNCGEYQYQETNYKKIQSKSIDEKKYLLIKARNHKDTEIGKFGKL